MLSTIPDDKRPAVQAAFRQGFGVDAPDVPPVRLAGGMSGAGLFRVRIGGIAYILRLEPQGPPPFGDLVRSHACMRTAAGACLAPRIRHADAAEGVVIMEMIEERPLSEYAGGRAGLIVELAQTVRLLHETPAFPVLTDYLAGMDTIVGWLWDAGLSTPEVAAVVDRFVGFRERYRTAPADLVSSHNDLNVRNVLYDGRRLWLIDWDAAFLADRYVDLAGAANWFLDGDDEVDLFLQTYFGAPPTEAQRARLFLMRQVNHLFYGIMFLLSAAGAGTADLAAAPPLQGLRARVADGTLDLWEARNRLVYGSALLAAADAGFRSPAFAEALARAGAGEN